MKKTVKDPSVINVQTSQQGFKVEKGHEPGLIGRQWRLLVKLTTKFNQIIHQIVTSPAIRSHVISIIQAEGISGIVRRLRRMRSNINRIDQTSPIFKARPLSLSAWIERFDTPDEDDLVHLAQVTRSITVNVCIITNRKNAGLISNTVNSLKNSNIINCYGQIWFSSDIQENERAPITTVVNELKQFTLPDPPISSDVVILVEAGTILRHHALGLLSAQLMQSPKTTIIYADEIRTKNNGAAPWFKPDYSPLMARSGRLFGGLVALKGSETRTEQFLRQVKEDPAKWQATLISWANTLPRNTVGHLPHLLSEASTPFPDYFDTTPVLTDKPKVSIIIPTRNYWSVLQPCLDSLKQTDWPKDKMEILIIDNGSDDEITLKGLSERSQSGEIKIIRHDKEFNWSELNNIGAVHATGSVLVFLNNDVEIIEPGWLSILVAFALEPECGVVGCKLLYPDRTVQHGGVVIGVQGAAAHAHLFIPEKEGGYQDLANISREISAVTGACIAVERSKFNEVGGFDESFKVAFNDIAFSVSLAQRGYFNIYAANAVLIHHESKSRGYDTTPEKIERNRNETIHFWNTFRTAIRDDKYYSPNLTYQDLYKLSPFPRCKPAWRKQTKRPRILMLSITHAKGHGVPVVIALQAAALAQTGFDVIIAGPQSNNDFPYEGCTFVEVHNPEDAALVALLYRVDCVVAHTPPFFSTVRWLGSDFPFIAYDYGEPPPAWFEDANARRDVNNEKAICLAMADRVYAISDAVRNESPSRMDGILRLGNSHLGQWTAEAAKQRQQSRDHFGFSDRFIILNVCRFQKGERQYKGVDRYTEIMRQFKIDYPELAQRVEFVLCGKGTVKDIQDMRKIGLSVYPNVSDATMKDLYLAADAYMSLSQWEGYNLGIAQALAMGLPTFASDIPAHRAFGIEVDNDTKKACRWIANRIGNAAEEQLQRRAQLWTWDEPLSDFVEIIRKIATEKAPFQN